MCVCVKCCHIIVLVLISFLHVCNVSTCTLPCDMPICTCMVHVLFVHLDLANKYGNGINVKGFLNIKTDMV